MAVEILTDFIIFVIPAHAMLIKPDPQGFEPHS